MFKVNLLNTRARGVRLLVVGGVSAVVLASTAAVSQGVPTSGPAANGQPEWFIYQAPAAGAGFTPRPTAPIEACAADSARLGVSGPGERDRKSVV